ncbi:MAG: hypothetical protein PHC88_11280 [Terrimicrobiaceae bacterium]|nr:hypothetical protein [Terrimicrobiaceae bacterium]
MIFRPTVRIGRWLAVALCLGGAVARADEFVTVDFPMQGRKIVAPGLSATPRQVVTPDGVGYTEVLLRPVRKDYRVFLTFVFNEDGGKGPAVFWSGDATGSQVTISENIAEGVVGLNRRTVALPAEVANEAGHLYIMGRLDRLLRLRIDWCEPSTVLVAADQERPSFISGGAVWLDRETTGQPAMTPPDVWFGPVLDAALQDGVADLSENIELVVPVNGATGRTRLRAKFLGLPLGKSVRVWVNGRLAGRMQPTLPGLTDPGYVRRGRRTTYAGWREGALFLEAGALKDGKNSILFESPGKSVYLSGAAMEIEAAAADASSEGKPPSEDAASPQAPADLPTGQDSAKQPGALSP